MNPYVFKLTQEHIALMKELRFYYEDDCEYGGPSVDMKRPFGNSGRTQIVRDMAEALGIPDDKVCDRDGELIEPEASRIEGIYRELPKAIECVFRSGSMEPGIFEAPRYTSKWVRIGDAPAGGDTQEGGGDAQP